MKNKIMPTLNKIATLSALVMAILKFTHVINVSWWIVFCLPLALVLYGFLNGLFRCDDEKGGK